MTMLIDRRILREKERRGGYATLRDNSEFFVELWTTGDEERNDADVYIYIYGERGEGRYRRG